VTDVQDVTAHAQLAAARAVFRRERDAERERLAADREELDRLTAEAKTLAADAARRRDRTKRLAFRFARRVRHKWADVQARVESRQAAADDARGQLSAEVARFEIARSEFHVAAAEDEDRLRAEWAALDGQRRRAAAERAEADEYHARQDAVLATREQALAAREKALAAPRKKLDAEAAALRAEAAGLDARVVSARAVVEELERKRDALRAELLGAAAVVEADPPAGHVALDRRADRDLSRLAADLDARDWQLTREKAAVAVLKATLDRENAEFDDRRRVLSEQFTLLATARAQWQDAEHRTVAEMEDLARDLRAREQDLDARADRLAKADARRREDAYELWQFRLRLEAWQSKLTAVEGRWHAERQRRDTDHDRRVTALTRREAEVEAVFARWEKAREIERERLRAELQLWADDRDRRVTAAAAADSRAAAAEAEVATHAARALAAEEAVAGAAGTARGQRRLDVMRKRWERVFAQKRAELDDRRAAAAGEVVALGERYRELHRRLADVVEREAARITQSARAEAEALTVGAALPLAAELPPDPAAAEIAVLRAEFERMATVLLDAGVPDAPDSELPWAAEDDEARPFARLHRAA